MLSRLRRIHALMRDDEQVDLATLHQRDRSIGESLAHLRRAPGAQVLAWAEARGVDVTSEDAVEGRVLGLLWVVGIVLGLAAAAGALYFEGGGRVNVVALLAVLVGLQLVSVGLSVLGMLPTRVRRAVPGLSFINDAFTVLSPSRAALATARRVAPSLAASFDSLAADAEHDARLFARIRRWTLWIWSQAFAVAFNVGLVVGFAALVVFTDLAFGWSTTLEVSAASVHELVHVLALPWRNLLPDAVPSLELVELSRYFRAGSSLQVDPVLLGGWWRFVFACLLVYALLPRLALLVLARWRRNSATAWTLRHLPGAPELLYRLNHEQISTRGEGAAEPLASEPHSDARLTFAPSSGPCSVVLWGIDPLPPEQVERQVQAATGLDPVERRPAGGARSVEHDRAVVDALANSTTPVVVSVKSWEPPLAELADFLQDVRRVSDDARALIVVPVAAEGAAVSPDDVAIWRERLARIGDPWLSVRAGTAGDAQ